MQKKPPRRIGSSTVEAGSKRYHFDIMTDWYSNQYIQVTEHHLGNNPWKAKIKIYPRDFDKFKKALDEIINLQRSKMLR